MKSIRTKSTKIVKPHSTVITAATFTSTGYFSSLLATNETMYRMKDAT